MALTDGGCRRIRHLPRFRRRRHYVLREASLPSANASQTRSVEVRMPAKAVQRSTSVGAQATRCPSPVAMANSRSLGRISVPLRVVDSQSAREQILSRRNAPVERDRVGDESFVEVADGRVRARCVRVSRGEW